MVAAIMPRVIDLTLVWLILGPSMIGYSLVASD